MKKNKKKLLSITSSLFGIAALCGIFSLSVFSRDRDKIETQAASESALSSILRFDDHVSVNYNKLVNSNWEITRAVDYNVSYRATLMRVAEFDNTNYYVRIEWSYFALTTHVNTGTEYDCYFRPTWSNFGNNQEWMEVGGWVMTTPYLESNTSFSFDLRLVNAGIWSDGSSDNGNNFNIYDTFRLVDLVTGTSYGSGGTTFDMTGVGRSIPVDGYQDPMNYPENFRYNYDGYQSYTSFSNLVFDSDLGNYDLGYSAGYNSGYMDGYDVGFTNGHQSMTEYAQTQYDYYYNLGLEEGTSIGYNEGYNDGAVADGTVATIFSGILQVGMLPINMFLAIFNFEILGINMSSFVSAILTVCITIIVVKVVIGSTGGGKE